MGRAVDAGIDCVPVTGFVDTVLVVGLVDVTGFVEEGAGTVTVFVLVTILVEVTT